MNSGNTSYPRPVCGENRRVSPDEALELLTRVPVGDLMRRAYGARAERFPGRVVTYVLDTNPNYTNVCVTGCRFCAFSRPQGHAEAYTLSPRSLAERVRKSYERGATTVLLQGGHHPGLRLSDWLAYVRCIRAACPHIHIHPFSPSEVVFLSKTTGAPVPEILGALYAEGIRTIPGGGAEILCDRVRARIAPEKATAAEWLAVAETAHRMGFRTTATMMFGHVETDEEIIEHLVRLRDLQDRTGGFSSFIPWSFKPGNSPLGKEVCQSAHPLRYVRVLATARLVLDNIDHIQSSWFSESITAGQLGLLAGADDFGGILFEENVLQQAGHQRATTLDTVLTVIRRAGFVPARRDSLYNVIEEHDDAAAGADVLARVLARRTDCTERGR